MFSSEIIIQALVAAIGFLFIFFFTIRSFKKKAFKSIEKKFPEINKKKLFLFQEISPKNLPTWKNFLKNKNITFYYLYLCEDKLRLFNFDKNEEIICTEYKRDHTLISVIKNNDLFPGFGSYLSINKENKRLILGSSTLRKKTLKSIIAKLEQIFPAELIIFDDEKIEEKSKRIRVSLYSLILIVGGVLTYYLLNTPTNDTSPIYVIVLTLIIILILFCIISLMLLPVERLKYIKD